MSLPRIDRIFFHGGSFGILGYLGVIPALKGSPIPGEYNVNLFESTNHFVYGNVRNGDVVPPIYGVSSGALTVLLLVLDISFDEMYSIFSRCSSAAHLGMIGGDISLTHQHYTVFNELFSRYPSAYELMNESDAHVGITTRSGFKWISKFESNQHLQEIMLGSFHIPLLCTHDPYYNGEMVLDGGIGFDESKFMEKYPDSTLTISTSTSKMASIQCKVPKIQHIIPSYSHEDRIRIILDAYNDTLRVTRYNKNGQIGTYPNIVGMSPINPFHIEDYIDYIWYIRNFV
jgi:hypothetical protein